MAIEQVQRRATRLVQEIRSLPYEDRLRYLGLPTLVYRRERADMIQIFKIMGSHDQVHMKNLKIKQSITRGHSKRIEKRQYNSSSALNSFLPRATNAWNALPDSCVNSETVNNFKSELNEAWKTKASKFIYRDITRMTNRTGYKVISTGSNPYMICSQR